MSEREITTRFIDKVSDILGTTPVGWDLAPPSELIECIINVYTESVTIPCVECAKPLVWPRKSNEALGVFNSFCEGGECEDKYASKQ